MESLQLPTAAFDRAAVVFVDAMTAALAAEAAPFTGAQPAVCNDVVAAQRLLRRCRTLLADLLREAKAAPSLGFWHAASWLDANLDLALTQSRPLREGELRVLGQWPQAVARCCEAPGAAAVVALLSLVDDTCWLLRPSATSREGMRVALAGYRRPAAAPATPVEEAATDREECSLLVGHAAAGHAAAAHAAATHSAVDHAAVDHAAVDHAFFPLETLVGFEVEVAVDAGDDGGPASAAEAGPPPGLSMPCAVEPESPARNDQIGRPPALLGDDEVETFSAAFEALASTAAGGVRRASDRRLYRQALQGVVGLAQLHARTDLVEACARVAKNLDAMDAQPEVSETVPLLLLDFPVAALNYVGAPHDRESAEVLLGCLSDGAWPYPLEDSELFQMRALLRFEEPTQQPPALETWTPRDATVEVHTEGERSAPAIAARTPLPPVPTGLQQCDPEQLAVLATEFAAFATTLSSELEATDPSGAPAQRQRVLASCAELLGRFGGAAEAIGLTALQWVFAFVAAHVAAAQDRGLTQTQRRCLREWSRRVRAYLAAPTDPSAGAALAEWLTEEPWSSLGAAVDAHVVADLEGALIALDLVRSATVDTRPTQATAADVSLAIPADVNAELLDGLLSELPIQSAEFAAATQRLAAGGSLYDIEAAKRAAHTLKGAAHTVGVKGIANLTHHLEDILIGLTRHGALPPHALADVLSSAADCLEAMCEAVLGVSPPPGDAQQVLQQVLDWAVRVDREGAEAFEGAASAAPVPASATVASAAAAATSQAEAHAGPMLRVPAAVVDELLRLVGETMIANTQIREQLRLSAAHTQAVTRQSQALQQLTAELETLIDVRGAAAPLQALQTMRARSGAPADFDALEFEHFNELHTVSRRLIEAATDARELSGASAERLSALADLIETQARLHLENQGVVMKTRMVPVGSIVSRLQRSVRQTGRLLDKRVELHVHGLDTTIDSNVLSELVDPLMHVLRNAIDHGIEAPPARVAAGKPVTGRIDLAFAREGAAIVVRCTDDGAGLDYARIRATAAAQGLLGTGQSVAEDELARLILRAGFSTRSEATQVSGRGIGMDVVSERVRSLKGTLRLQSVSGRGLTVEIRLPASLMTTHGLLVRVNGRTMALSTYGIEDIRYVTRDEVTQVGDAQMYQTNETAHALDRIESLLAVPVGEETRDWFPALLVRTDNGVRAVRVPEVLDSQDIVLKDLGCYVPRPAGVVGVTILGDGSIAPVIDLPQLLHAGAGEGHAPIKARAASAEARTSPIEGRLTALVVDDSLSARRSGAQLMKDAGFDVRTAIDGMEAAAMIEKKVPDVVLVDMEMPRMNGLEFTIHLRSREATRAVPIIMITSRSTEKHRRQAAAAGVDVYLTKPFNDDELLRHVDRLTAAVPAR